MNDTPSTGEAPSAPYPTRSEHTNGQRGKRLAAMRQRASVGQRHMATELGMSQPELSAIEREVYGGVPRGFSGRYTDHLFEIVHAGGQRCFPGCGCRA